jgi:protein TonB
MKQNQTGFFYIRRRAVGFSVILHGLIIFALLISSPMKGTLEKEMIFVFLLSSTAPSEGVRQAVSGETMRTPLNSSPLNKKIIKHTVFQQPEKSIAGEKMPPVVKVDMPPAIYADGNESGEGPADADSAVSPAQAPQTQTRRQAASGGDGFGGQGSVFIGEARFGEAGAPFFLYQEMPAYPVQARRLGMEGRVVLKLLIDANGKLLNVEVIESAGYGFTEASIEAVKKSTYAPGIRDGIKVATRALLPISFRLQ